MQGKSREDQLQIRTEIEVASSS